jgi:D-alanyl-D-alanine-carboxypeptidase/D-alanyl-D-alanine-endopeptidase
MPRASTLTGMRLVWALCSIVVIAAALAQPARGQATSFPTDSSILAMLRARLERSGSTAIVVGLLEDGKRRVIAHGTTSRGGQVVGGNTVFEIGSITKVFTGTLLADMARRGEIKLEDPVSKYLPASVRMPSSNGRRITVGDLADQHSGLPRLPDNLNPANPKNPYADYPADSMFAFLSRHTLARAPGARFEYSNLGVGLLGHALARRAGTTYETLLIERILDPLGLDDTRITLTPSMRQRLAAGHDASGVPAENWDIPSLAGAGALRSTANDLLDFAAAALGTPGPLAAAFEMAQRPRHDINPRMSIGLNWFTARAGNVAIVWHNGGTGGYRSYLGLDKGGRRAVVVLTNSQNGADDIGRHLLDPVLPLASAP